MMLYHRIKYILNTTFLSLECENLVFENFRRDICRYRFAIDFLWIPSDVWISV